MMDPATLLTWQGLRDAVGQELRLFNGFLVGGKTLVWADKPRQLTVMKGLRAGSVWFTEDPSAWERFKDVTGGPVVIVSQHHDTTIREFTCPPSVGHWFAPQVACSHPQLTAMPVGIDRRMVPSLQRAESKPWAERDILLYLNFQKRTPERTALYEQFRGMPGVVCERWDRENADHYARQLGRSKFVLCPGGHAWDCYRTYEAIAMGSIPIVKRDRPHSDVANDLPVFVVNEWSEITRSELARVSCVHDAIIDGRYPKLTQAYWVKQIAAKAKELMEAHSAVAS